MKFVEVSYAGLKTYVNPNAIAYVCEASDHDKKNKGGQCNALIFLIGGGEDNYIFTKETCDVILSRIDDVTFWNKQEVK